MTHYDVYIGDIENVQDVGVGHFPNDISKLLPDSSQHSIYSNVYALARSGEFPAEETFWGCWVVELTRDQLLKYLDEWYGEGPIYPSEWTIRGKNPDDYEIRSLVRRLDPDKRYGLVAMEV